MQCTELNDLLQIQGREKKIPWLSRPQPAAYKEYAIPPSYEHSK